MRPEPPRTRFQGSKRKLLPWIEECLGDRRIDSAIDLMSGTSTVAHHFKARGWRVVANDYMRSNYLTAVALVENPGWKLSEDDVAFISRQDGDFGDFFIKDTFPGFYFTEAENEWLDKALQNLDRLQQRYCGDELKYKHAVAFHALAQAALMKRPFNLFHRKNLYIRTADVHRSFGNKTTWETPFPNLFKRQCVEINNATFANGQDNIALNSRAEVLDFGDRVDLVYLDPPYFMTKRDDRPARDYRFLYHFTEGMAVYSQWPTLINHEDHRLPLKVEYAEADPYLVRPAQLADALTTWFRTILEQWPESTLVMSYKSPGVPSLDQLHAMMRELRPKVEVFEKPYSYALSRSRSDGASTYELLLIAE
jgi:adenine-specific DNA methylase